MILLLELLSTPIELELLEVEVEVEVEDSKMIELLIILEYWVKLK